MNELTTGNQEGTHVIDSLQVAEMVGIEHYELLKSIRQYCEYLTKSNFVVSEFFVEHSYQDSIGRTLPCYFLTRKGYHFVANKISSEKGILSTATYVARLEEMENALIKKLPQTYAQALRELAEKVEEKERQTINRIW